MEENEVKTKKCTKCGMEKPLSEFALNRRAKDGLQYYCKDCSNRVNSERYWRKKGGDCINKVYLNPKLADFQPRELIAELRARGYRGELSYTQCIQV